MLRDDKTVKIARTGEAENTEATIRASMGGQPGDAENTEASRKTVNKSLASFTVSAGTDSPPTNDSDRSLCETIKRTEEF